MINLKFREKKNELVVLLYQNTRHKFITEMNNEKLTLLKKVMKMYRLNPFI